MYSKRFGKAIIVTNHARARMAERNVDELALVCAAAVEESQLVIKTVMVNWVFRG